MKTVVIPILVCVTLISALSAQVAAKPAPKTFADQGIIELGGRVDFSYSSEDRGGNLGRQSQGLFYLAPQLGYFFVKSFEISVFPVLSTKFYSNQETETSYGALVAPAYVLPFLRPWFPYVEGLAGSLLTKNTVSLTYGAGVGLRILILENALLKIGVTYLRNDKRSRLDNNVFQIEDAVTLSLGFGIFF